ncbi:hypothetical protein [Plantactinospora endophytica]|uniref:Uncharacterized protein n=1 Tax=Plantactinospora endophytica TaxID=673535 RepID=A0ABQ4E3Z3_9ACTN|nr:hypothetical protein [Plantactinospora endophytica]GIG89429.1 hypothetical protein Pen02_43650 [Plantactinospora endophytica]
MRHLGSLLFGLVIAPIVWVLAGIGLIRFNGGITQDRTGDMILGFVVILLVGGLLAVLLLPRWSPIGPAAAGLLFMAMALWSMVDFGSMTEVMPRSFLGVDFALTAPAGALATLLAVLLGATVLVPHRWRSPRPAAGLPGAVGQPGYPSYPAPGGQYPPGTPPPSGSPYPPAPAPPGGQVVPGQFAPGAPGLPHPPNYGPSAAPSYAQSAPPNFGPAVPPNYGPTAPAHHPPSAPPYNAPTGAPHYAPPVVPSAPPAQPTYSPLTPPAPPAAPPGRPRSDETTQFSGRSDETTQFTGGPDDDGMDGITRRLGDR